MISKSTNRKGSSKSAVRQAAFETLENRQLMSVSVANGFLNIDGTVGNDTISVTPTGFLRSSYEVNVNGEKTTVSAIKINRVVVQAFGGNDVVTLSKSVHAPATIVGGLGNDTLVGGSGDDVITGGEGNDSLDGGLGADVLYGEAGTDTVDYSSRTTGVSANLDGLKNDGASGELDTIKADVEKLVGGSGNDNLAGNAGPNALYGNGGNDTLNLGAGDDTGLGGDGDDMIFGNDGKDFILAGDGKDFLDGGLGGDTISGGAGEDTVAYHIRTGNLTITLNDNASNDGEAGEKDFLMSDLEDVLGGWGNDVIVGTNDANKLYGGAGNDVIKGLGGADTLDGAAGNDSLYAGAGVALDTLLGGDGNDLLVSIGGSADVVKGQAGTDSFWVDKIDLTDATAAERNAGWFHAIWGFSNGASTELAGQNLTDPGLSGYAAHYAQSFSSTPLFGPGGPQMTDVDQAGLGDCWFLAGLAGVARAKPDVIRQSVVDLGDGTYAVQLFDGNTAKVYRVDGQLPLRNDNNNVIFAQRANNTLWAPIMEKAYAFHRSGSDQYKDMNSGWSDEAFKALGKYTETDDVIWHSEDSLASAMRTRLLNGGAVTACTDPPILGSSIVPSHCYTVIGVSADLKTITLRNPWARDGQGTHDTTDDGIIKISMSQFDDDVWQIGYGWL